MPLTTVQQILSRISNQFDKTATIYLDNATTRTQVWNAITQFPVSPRLGYIETLPSTFETGVTSYIPTEISLNSSTAMPAMICEMIDMGNLNISTNVFTDGSAAPTRTYLGTSRQLPMQLWIECTTALNATPGSMSFTYVDQDNNTAEASSSLALVASATVGSGSMAQLNSNDWGVLDITTASRTGGTSPTGVIKFWGLIPITYILPGSAFGGSNGSAATDIFPESGNFVRLGTSTQLGVVSLGTTTATSSYGYIRYVGDN